jgi:hypothetical protein
MNRWSNCLGEKSVSTILPRSGTIVLLLCLGPAALSGLGQVPGGSAGSPTQPAEMTLPPKSGGVVQDGAKPLILPPLPREDLPTAKEEAERKSRLTRSSQPEPPKDPSVAKAQMYGGSSAPVAEGEKELPGPAPLEVQTPSPIRPRTGTRASFLHRFMQGYPNARIIYPEYFGQLEGEKPAEPERPRRAFPAPFSAPPFPSSEFQGYPLLGIPQSTGYAEDLSQYPLMGAVYGSSFGEFFKENRIKMYGWITAAGNFSNSKNSNTPASYWIVPNSIQMDQYVFRIERETDTVQTDHIDWGFRSTHIYGIDYRYTTAGGWFSDQLLRHNSLYGYDPLEQYFDIYVPGVAQGLNIRIGRWVACPDIETQLAPDNFLGSHSLLFTYDTYTQTGILNTFLINNNWMVQGGIHAGTDMAPWYQGALATGMFGIRWVSDNNKDSIYTDLNALNNAKFRYFKMDGQLVGHDNFNYVVSTWQHKFNNRLQTRTEGYFMWQINAVTGGTPSIGPTHLFGGGGGIGKYIPGTSLDYGVLNYTMYALTKSDYITFRNEWWRDQEGERTGFKTSYSSTTLGLSHQFTQTMMVRPEIGYYHSYDVPAFDLGKHKDMLMLGCDFTIRF